MGTNETTAQEAYNQFWPKATEEIRAMGNAGLKHQELPLARIKKVSYYLVFCFLWNQKLTIHYWKKRTSWGIALKYYNSPIFRETKNKHRVIGQSKFQQNESFLLIKLMWILAGENYIFFCNQTT